VSPGHAQPRLPYVRRTACEQLNPDRKSATASSLLVISVSSSASALRKPVV
jgi:hypothetical protein